MSSTARVTIDTTTVSPSRAILAASRGASLVILGENLFGELVAELGGHEEAMRHLLRVSENTNRPIGVNFPTPEGSRTAFVAPRSWTQERLRGWVGGRHEGIEAMFGAGTAVAEDEW